MHRTRNEWNLKFEQTIHGEKQHGQTPAAMFLETYNGFGFDPNGFGTAPRVSVLRRRAGGKLTVAETNLNREDVLLWVLRCADGHMTAFDHDDYSARLVPLDGDGKIAWIELLNPNSHPDDHPELGAGGH